MLVLVDLSAWAIAIVALGIALCITVFVLALLGWLIDLLNKIPTVSIGTEFLHTVEQAVTSAFGTAFAWVDKELGASIHAMARLVEWVGSEIEHNAVALAEMVPVLGNIVAAIENIRALAHHSSRASTVQAAQVKTLEREYNGIEHQVKTLEREYHGIDQVAVRHRLRAIDKELHTLEAQTIPAIQQAESDAQSAINNLYDWAKGKASLLGIGTFATAVAAALGLSSLSGFLCNEFRNILGRGCSGLWSGIDNLLGLFIDLFVITDLCDVIPVLEQGYADVAAPAVAALTAAIDEMPCVNGNQAAPLAVASLSLPPVRGISHPLAA